MHPLHPGYAYEFSMFTANEIPLAPYFHQLWSGFTAHFCLSFVALRLPSVYKLQVWRRGVAVECPTRNQEVAGSSLGRALPSYTAW